MNAKTGGIKNVIVWLGPDLTAAQAKELEMTGRVKLPSFAKADIHPALVKPAKPSVEIDQPCCRFIPHIVLLREGQDLIIKNSSTAGHNARFEASESGIAFNQIIPMDQPVTVKGLKAERLPVEVTCSIHSWMNARLAVFAHPYFAATDDEGNFEIKDAPVLGGKLRLFAYHEAIGFHGGIPGPYGRPVAVKGPTTDLGFDQARVQRRVEGEEVDGLTRPGQRVTPATAGVGFFFGPVAQGRRRRSRGTAGGPWSAST